MGKMRSSLSLHVCTGTCASSSPHHDIHGCPYHLSSFSCPLLLYYLHQISKSSPIKPGTYEGIVEPNLEDAEMSCSKVEKSKTTRSVQMKVQ